MFGKWMDYLRQKKELPSWRTAVSALRREYTGSPLTEEEAGDCPFELFEQWFAEAAERSLHDANAFVLSTSDETGAPSSRVVLLKGWDKNGFKFYTDLGSKKSLQISLYPSVSALFYWPETFRQLRVEGKAELLNRDDVLRYFNSRPIESRISAVVSPQSRTIDSRRWLEKQKNELDEKLKNGEIDKNELLSVKSGDWGGYCIKPNYFEFWQGRTGRLHDRIVFELDKHVPSSDSFRNSTAWQKYRIAP
ncbi:MAG: pyridoxamine 5'-phosphate oxidase [Balneolales bacterium]|nr:pyridoxamine 5'-phosphate oxidase [Balneolales bacterium]